MNVNVNVKSGNFSLKSKDAATNPATATGGCQRSRGVRGIMESVSSLFAAVPAALLKKLQSRGGSDRRLTTSHKENKENDDDTFTAPTPEKPTRMPSDRLSPCAREAQRLEEKRRLRRLEQDTARERAALTDETSEFKEMITLFREKKNATDAVAADAAAPASAERLRVCVRKRPLLPSELQANEFDVITAYGRRAVLHQTRRRVNLERCVDNHSFSFDAVFDEAAGTEAVYSATARPLVRGILAAGGRMTCFAYGQTGSGKTYTMEGGGVAESGLYSLVARDCFAAVEAAAAAGTPLRLSMSMFEIYRETVYDILTPQPSASKVSVLEDAASEVGTLPSSLGASSDCLPHLCTRGRRERGDCH